MMRNVYIPCLILIQVVIDISALGQNNYSTRHYTKDIGLINPASIGSDYFPKITLLSEKQFLGIDHSPSTYFITSQVRVGKFDFYDPRKFINEHKIKSKNRIGLGGAILYDRDGPLSQLMVNIAYAYHLPMGTKSELSFGLLGSYNHNDLSISELNPTDPDDLILYDDYEKDNDFNSDAGVYFSNPKYFAGISVKNVFPSKRGIDNEKIDIPDFYLIGGYTFGSKPLRFLFEPSFVLKREHVNEKFLPDIHTKFYFKAYNWAQISFRDLKTINFCIALRVYRTLYVGYSYEFATGDVGRYNYGSHGIMIGMNTGLRKPEAYVP